MFNLKVITALFLLFTSHTLAANTKLTHVDIRQKKDSVDLVLSVNNTVSYKITTLPHPNRIVVDLKESVLSTVLEHVNLTNTSVKKIASQTSPTNLRLIFEIDEADHFSSQVNTDRPERGEQLIISFHLKKTLPLIKSELISQQKKYSQSDIPIHNVENKESVEQTLNTAIMATLTSTKTVHANAEKIIVNKENDTKNSIKQSTSSLSFFSQSAAARHPIIIVIDAGHGGKDPGTISNIGIKEKTVVLAISKELQNILNKKSLFQAVLTRSSDYFIPLRKRLAIAHRYKADLFVAIHADAFINSYASGSSVFALSAHGASSEAARWLAEKENYSELGGVNLSNKNDKLRSVLIDLSQTATISASFHIGDRILYQLRQIGRLHRGFVEQAPFMVLKNPDIPSLLIETGFLSNPVEAQQLNNPLYQAQIALAIATGIEAYFKGASIN